MKQFNLNKIFYRKNKTEDPIYKAEVTLFLIGLFLIALNCFNDLEQPEYKKFVLISSVVAAILFFVFAFVIRRKPIVILLASISLFTIILVVDAIIHPSQILNHLFIKAMVYFLLIKTFTELKSQKSNSI